MNFFYKNWEVFELNKNVIKTLKFKKLSDKKINYLKLLDFDSGIKLFR